MTNPVAIVLNPRRFLGVWFAFALFFVAAYGALLASSMSVDACNADDGISRVELLE